MKWLVNVQGLVNTGYSSAFWSKHRELETLLERFAQEVIEGNANDS
jgi:hypothetical protein